MKLEEITERYIRLAMAGDNRPLKLFMKGRSPAFRAAIYRQLKRWNCEQDVPIRLLTIYKD